MDKREIYLQESHKQYLCKILNAASQALLNKATIIEVNKYSIGRIQELLAEVVNKSIRHEVCHYLNEIDDIDLKEYMVVNIEQVTVISMSTALDYSTDLYNTKSYKDKIREIKRRMKKKGIKMNKINEYTYNMAAGKYSEIMKEIYLPRIKEELK